RLQHEPLRPPQWAEGDRDDELEIADVRDLRAPHDPGEGDGPAIDGVDAAAPPDDHATIGDHVLAAVGQRPVHGEEPATEPEDEHGQGERLAAPRLPEGEEEEREEKRDVGRGEQEEQREPEGAVRTRAGATTARPAHLLGGEETKHAPVDLVAHDLRYPRRGGNSSPGAGDPAPAVQRLRSLLATSARSTASVGAISR